MNNRKVTVWLTYGFPFIVGVVVFALFAFVDATDAAATSFYQDKMRGSLFAGFLTLGSFLLSLKTGIVIKIKENVYDQAEYQSLVVLAKAGGTSTTVYGPLQRLSKMLSSAVLSALIAAILQLTVGLINAWWAAAVCLAAAAIAVTFLLFAFALIQINMQRWFKYLEDKLDKAAAEAAAKKQGEVSTPG